MDSKTVQPHILLGHDDIHPVVLTVGDPQRALDFAQQADSFVEKAYNREYRSFEAIFKGEKFTIISHGVGAAGAAICFEELIQLGVNCIIRVGTCGSLQPERIKTGEILLIHSAVREEGVTALHVPKIMPAVSSMDTYWALREHASKLSIAVTPATTLTTDSFYKSRVLPGTLEMWSKARVEAVEMEASALFIIARLAGIDAGAIVVVDGSPLEWSQGNYDPTGSLVKLGKQNMCKIALNTIATLTEKYRTTKQ